MVTADQDRQERRERHGRRDDDGREMRRLGRTDLLGLHRDFEYWNPPRDPKPTAAAPGAGPAADVGDPHDSDGEDRAGSTVEVERG